MEEWSFGDNRGLENPIVTNATRCPDDCGLCNLHTSHTGLANVDLTNRCNLTCPVCFANANAAGYLYEPDFETVRKMLQALRDERPVAGRLVPFSELCNLTCPVCFANANAAGYLYEPDFETVRKMLQALRDERPVAGRIVQFSGGEPTIYPRFLDVLRLAKEMGFS